MTSPAANLFLALRTLIANLADGQGNPDFRYVDQDLGQLEMERPPVLWPCVLIDIDEMSFRNMTDAAQLGTVKVVLRLGFPPYSGTAASTPDAYAQMAIAYYDLEQVLFLALHNQPIPGLADIFGSPVRTSSATERRRDLLRVRQLTFSIGLDDYSATVSQHTASATKVVYVSFYPPDIFGS